jgi:D-galactarolactone cycloisomerase
LTIHRVEPLALRIPFQNQDGAPAIHLVFCRVTTKAGVTGYGESLCYLPTMQRALVAAISDVIAPAYVGESVGDREALNVRIRQQYAAFGRAGPIINALAAVDIALWDIAGKEVGRPISDLLGGAKRTSVPIMASLDRHGDLGKVRRRIERALDAGTGAIKVHEKNLDLIEEARAVAGSQTRFVVDLNNSHSAAQIVHHASRWEALDLLWLEDPVWPPEHMLRNAAFPRVPLGLGGEVGSAEQMLLYVEGLRAPVVQPDVCMIGGVSEAKRALPLLVASGAAIMPHTPFLGPAALASLHLISTLPEEAYFAMIEADDHMDPYEAGLTCWSDAIQVPARPGLGFDPVAGYTERYAFPS